MIRINQIKLGLDHSQEDLRKAIIKKLNISDVKLLDFVIIKKSIDARDKSNIFFVYAVDAAITCEELTLKKNRNANISRSVNKKYAYPEQGMHKLNHRPVVVGSGPAGLFCAYFLAKEGYRPIVIERGECVEERIKTVERFWNKGELNPNSNIQFGEGGAGTFSDGKLNTGVNDPMGRNNLVLQTFADNGAFSEILYLNKPHLGTDELVSIVSNMRRSIIEHGGEFGFNSCFEKFDVADGAVKGIFLTDGQFIPADIVVLAIGHSARDTFEYIIKESGLSVEAKAFAVGLRVEHPQTMINKSQYGNVPDGLLPAADYKLVCKTADGSSVYSFCMCPGGYVVNSSSEPGHVCVNGMSYSGRDSENANSAIVMAVSPSEDPMKNIRFQRELEQKTYNEGHGMIVSQRLSDFENDIPTTEFGSVKPVHKGLTAPGNINNILPEYISKNIKEAMHIFAHKIKDFDDPDVILSAIETRTSSPVRILRNDELQANIKGIYPAGEGAGYAGGITSAAIDGIKIFEKIYAYYQGL